MNWYLKLLNKVFGFNSIPPVAYVLGIPFFIIFFPVLYLLVFIRWSVGYTQCFYCKRYCSPKDHFTTEKEYKGGGVYVSYKKCTACSVGDKLVKDYR